MKDSHNLPYIAAEICAHWRFKRTFLNKPPLRKYIKVDPEDEDASKCFRKRSPNKYFKYCRKARPNLTI